MLLQKPVSNKVSKDEILNCLFANLSTGSSLELGAFVMLEIFIGQKSAQIQAID